MRTALIGLDGATFDLIKPWINEGHLPNLKTLIDSGVHGDLKSTIPPVTVPAFPSLYTGQTPEKMGLWGWKELDLKQNFVRRENISKLRMKKLWDYLSENELKSIWLNIPTTYPPSKLNGYMITGLTTPDINSNFTYPSELKKEILKEIPGYKIHPSFYYKKEREDEYLKEVENVLENRFKLARYLWENKDWDLFTILFRSPDNIFHFIWPDNPDRKEKVLRIHKKLDEYIGWFLDQDVNIIIFSDHGFTQNKYYINSNKLLIDHGYLSIKDKNGPCIKQSFLAWLKQKTKEFVRKHDLMWVVKKFFSQEFIDKIPDSSSSIIDSVDWGKSKVVSMVDAKVSKIYLKPGIKNKKEIINEVKKLFEELGERLGLKFEYLTPSNSASHLIVISNEKEWDFSDNLKTEKVVVEKKNSSHDHNGILIANGPDFTKGEINGARIWDLPTTLLHLYNIPIPPSMDGEVLMDLFSPESEASKRRPNIAEAKDDKVQDVVKNLTKSGKI